MQIFKIADKRFSIPTSYQELTVRQFVAISKTTDLVDILSILSDIPREDWLNCSDIDIDVTLAPWLAWLNVKMDWTSLQPPQSIKVGDRTIDVPRNLRVHTWGQKLLLEKIWRSVVNGQLNEADAIAEAVAIYLQPVISDSKFDDNKIDEVTAIINELPIVDIYPIASFFFRQIQEILKRESETLSNPPDKVQEQAGVKRLEKFGSFGSAYALAKGDILKIEAIYNTDYESIYTCLYYECEQAKFQKAYRELMTPKKQP